jgi:enoyl-CoA hydratase/carnithine racemase
MMEVMDKPVIAAVQGYAITGGFLLAYSSDMIIAAEDAVFADTHAMWGLIPNGGESQRLPRLVGKMKAKEIMFTSDQISAGEAERIGLVSKVVPRDKLDEAAEDMASRLLNNSRNSIAAIKSLINRGMEVDFATGLKLEGVVSKWGAVNREPNPDREARLRAFAEKTSSVTK